MSPGVTGFIIFIAATVCLICVYYIGEQQTTGYVLAVKNKTIKRASIERAASRLKFINYGLSTNTLTEDLSADDASKLYYEYVERIDVKCPRHQRLGSEGDGGWDVCTVGPYQLRKPCLVYSFGINWDFSFDDAVSKQFGCTVRSFDPSMAKANDHRRDENIWFYKIGLGEADALMLMVRWPVKTLESIVSQLNDTGKVIDYLKMDIENNEWITLETMYKSDILTRVKQLGIEIHNRLIGQMPTKSFFGRWKILKRLEEFGFRRWYYHVNKFGKYTHRNYSRSCCHEMVYINENFLNGFRDASL